MFRAELMDTLRIIDRGDLTPEEMIGSWAGELGQTQFLASHYLKHAVDYDGDGRRNLISSVPDVIASTANFLVPSRLAARRAVAAGGAGAGQPAVGPGRPRRPAPALQVGGLGRDPPDGRPLPSDAMPASLLLPMGRHGPAFLAYQNFQVYLQWNQSLNYCLTVAYLATRLAGAPPMCRGSQPIPELTHGAGQGAAAAAGAARLRGRRGRRQARRRDARQRQGGADEIRAAGQSPIPPTS